MKTKSFIIVSTILIVINFGCKQVLDCAIFPNDVSIQDRNFPIGIVSSNFHQTILCSVSAITSEKSIISYYDIEGDLPPGIHSRAIKTTNNYILIAGKPTTKGTYSFTLTVRMDKHLPFPDDDTDEICNDTDTKTYTITIK